MSGSVHIPFNQQDTPFIAPDESPLILGKDELNSDPVSVFTFLEKIGEGSYGSVHKAIHIRTGRAVAIKKIPIENDLEQSIKEINIMTGFESPFVVQFYGSYLVENELWIVMEFCAAGSVADIMRLTGTTMTEDMMAVICKDVLEGLAYLHSKRKIHRDIKAGNVLITKHGQSRLADFGVVGQLSDAVSKRVTVIGTPFWMAPEVIQEVGYGTNADIWSLGITCIEMAQGHPPYHHLHPMRAIFMIPSKPPPTLENEESFSSDFRNFVARCLTKNPTERPSATDLLNDPFIKRAQGSHVLEDIIAETLYLLEKGVSRWDSESEEGYQDESEDEENDSIDRLAQQMDGLQPPSQEKFDDATMKATPARQQSSPAQPAGLFLMQEQDDATIKRGMFSSPLESPSVPVDGTIKAVRSTSTSSSNQASNSAPPLSADISSSHLWSIPYTQPPPLVPTSSQEPTKSQISGPLPLTQSLSQQGSQPGLVAGALPDERPDIELDALEWKDYDALLEILDRNFEYELSWLKKRFETKKAPILQALSRLNA